MEVRDEFDTLFIVGTGAEAGAWRPVIGAINDVMRLSPRLGEDDRALANCALAELVHLRRTFHSPTYMQGAKGKEREMRDLVDRMDCSLKQVIAHQLMSAVQRGEITLRPRFLEVIRQPRWGRVRFCTTNWDHSLPAFLATQGEHQEWDESPPAFPIHGACWPAALLPRNLTLPMLLPAETHCAPQNEEPALLGAFRIAGQILLEQLQQARRVCLYGLGLDPLDTQLANLLRIGLMGRPREVRIFNLVDQQDYLVRRVSHLLRGNGTVHFEAVE